MLNGTFIGLTNCAAGNRPYRYVEFLTMNPIQKAGNVDRNAVADTITGTSKVSILNSWIPCHGEGFDESSPLHPLSRLL